MFKQKIHKKIKVDSWDKWIGEDYGVHNCLCCDRIKIKQSTFQGGHFKSEKNGGKISVNNIIPICAGCNSSMGSKNMDYYIKLFEPERYKFLLQTNPKWFSCIGKSLNSKSLNRYSGTDKLDNSKRVVYGFNAKNSNFVADLIQTYEFTNNSNFHKEQGNEKRLSDLLGALAYDNQKNIYTGYDFRVDVDEDYIKEQNIYEIIHKYTDTLLSVILT